MGTDYHLLSGYLAINHFPFMCLVFFLSNRDQSTCSLGLSAFRRRHSYSLFVSTCGLPDTVLVHYPPDAFHQKGSVPVYRWEKGDSGKKCHLSMATQAVHAGAGT